MLNMKEELLHFIWQYKLLKPVELHCQSGQTLKIINPGELNKDSGPDFFNAKLKIGNLTLAGNVEIHVNASEWYKHKHDTDTAYSSIILHAVFNDDLKNNTPTKSSFETIELKNYIDPSLLKKYETLVNSKNKLPCSKQLHTLNPLKTNSWLERMLIERLEKKTEYIKDIFEQTGNDYVQTFYITLARNFGFKVNAEAFESLARHLPIQVLLKHSSNILQVEALLFGCAGLLESTYKDKYIQQLQNEFEFLKGKYKLKTINQSVWKFMRMRPANFPSVRLWQFAMLIHKSPEIFSNPGKHDTVSKLESAIHHQPEGYWKSHFYADGKEQKEINGIGRTSIENILINTMAPFLFFYGKQTAQEEFIINAIASFDDLTFELNSKTKCFTVGGLQLKTAGESQALINLYDNYCKKHLCLNCGIASQLLLNS